jgi:outer membrane beta-barrel protein
MMPLRISRLRRFGVLLIALGLTETSVAMADEDELNSGRVIAVQNRPYRLVHEFSVSAGVFPLNAFYVGLSLGGSYTLHLSDLWAWEAASFHYLARIDTGLEQELADRFSVQPTSEPELEFLVGTHAIFSPLFGKTSIGNENVMQIATYLAFGGGVAKYSDGFRPMGSVGPGVRVYFGNTVSSKLDIRGVIVPDVPSGVEFVLQAMLSVSFNFGKVRATESDADGQAEVRTGFEALDELYPESDPALQRTKEDR